MKLIIYGDFNCPYSCLASARADRLLEAGQADVDWRAVQHDPTIEASGQEIAGELADDIDRELEQIRALLTADEHVVLERPPRRPNTALATCTFAGIDGDDAHRLRTRLFAAVWRDGRDIGDPRELHRHIGAEAPAPSGAEPASAEPAGAAAAAQAPSGPAAARAARWQEEWSGLERPMTPSLVLPDGYVSRGLGALSRLADLLK